MALRDLKVGDEVFVVHQRSRNQKERRQESGFVVRVGRKYAYIESKELHIAPVCRDTGCSVHVPDNNNARINGYGFDVYRNEAEYQRERTESSELKRLQDRLCARPYGIKALPPDVVADIHAVLDAHKKCGE